MEAMIGDSPAGLRDHEAKETPQRLKIVVLDGYPLAPAGPWAPRARPSQPGAAPVEQTPSHSDWDPLAELGDLTVYDRTPADQVVSRVGQAPIILLNKVRLTRPIFQQLPRLNYVGVLATGVDNVDLRAASDHGVTVTNVSGYSITSVAQHTFAMILELANLISAHNQAVHHGVWSACEDFSFTVGPVQELAGKVLGIVGLGKIGQRVAKIGSAFGMHVITTQRSPSPLPKIPGVVVRSVDLETLLEQSDIVSLHCPLNDATRHLINASRLAKMKKTAYLVNTGRGALVDEIALAEALYRGQIAGAALDVLSTEPPPADHPLLTAPRCLITPHIAWASVQAKRRLMRQVVENIEAFLKGQPINVITPGTPGSIPGIMPGNILGTATETACEDPSLSPPTSRPPRTS